MVGLIDQHHAVPPLPGVRWFFTTRQGGRSEGEFDSWNLGHHVGDHPATVAANRRLLAERLAVEEEGVCYLNQVHGVTTHQVVTPWQTPPDGDALVTCHQQRVLAIMVADCVPVLFADRQNRVVGAAHAGWRGALQGVLESCLSQMVALGAKGENIHAIIGPCIRGASYEVGEGFRQQFMQQDPDPGVEKCFIFHGKSVNLAMPSYVRSRLSRWGMAAERIHDVEFCTYAQSDLFFSYRRTTHQNPGSMPRCGRQVGGIQLL